MILYRDIRTAIARKIASAFPDAELYDRTQPDEFARPSFWVAFVSDRRRTANCSTVEVDAYFTVVCFLPRDDYGLSGEADLTDRMQELSDCFADGVLSLGNRVLKIKASNGGQDGDTAYLDIQTSWMEERGREPSELPHIEQVITGLDV